MRQGQQNRRGRGRGRRTQNPLTRNFESNGPDVKIRGTAAHIAEKYSTLARDALSSGDPITAENYLQHAEHYFRIIMAAQQPTQVMPNGPQPSAEILNGAGASAQPQPKPAASPPHGSSEKVEMPTAATDGAGDTAGVADGDPRGEAFKAHNYKADGAIADHTKSDSGKRRRRRTRANGESKSADNAGRKAADKTAAKEEAKSANPNKNGAETPSAEDAPPDGALA